MDGIASTLVVVAACLLAAAGCALLVRYLGRRPRATLRTKVLRVIAGLVGADLLLSPALVVALAGENLFALRRTAPDHWIVIGAYAVLTVYVFARLFPWRDVNALAAAPDADLRQVMRAIMRDEREPAPRDD